MHKQDKNKNIVLQECCEKNYTKKDTALLEATGFFHKKNLVVNFFWLLLIERLGCL